jgi:hypothetical protein
METAQSEVQHEILHEHIHRLFQYQQEVYEELRTAIGGIQDEECQRRVKSSIVQSQSIVVGLRMVHALIEKGDAPTSLAIQLSQLLGPTPTS